MRHYYVNNIHTEVFMPQEFHGHFRQSKVHKEEWRDCELNLYKNRETDSDLIIIILLCDKAIFSCWETIQSHETNLVDTEEE